MRVRNYLENILHRKSGIGTIASYIALSVGCELLLVRIF